MPKRVEYRGDNIEMKPRPEPSEFNTLQEMLARFAFILFLGSFIAGFLLVTASLFTHELRTMALGLLLLGFSMLARMYLRRGNEFQEAESALGDVGHAKPPVDASQVAGLVQLLREWEALESRRGSPGFDPWALQSVRHDIRVIIDENPALEGLFHAHRHAA